MKKTVDEGGGYRIRAIRKSAGMFEVIAIDWEHPNYGYFADAMLWVWSLHQGDWRPIPIAKWTEKYRNPGIFLRDYPMFSEFFGGIGPEKALEMVFQIDTQSR